MRSSATLRHLERPLVFARGTMAENYHLKQKKKEKEVRAKGKTSVDQQQDSKFVNFLFCSGGFYCAAPRLASAAAATAPSRKNTSSSSICFQLLQMYFAKVSLSARLIQFGKRRSSRQNSFMYLLTERNFLDEATDWRCARGGSVVAPAAALGNCVLCKDSINRHQSFPTTFCRPTNLPTQGNQTRNKLVQVCSRVYLHSHTSSNSRHLFTAAFTTFLCAT